MITRILAWFLGVFLLFASCPVFAGQTGLEKGLNGSLKDGDRIIQQLKSRISDGKPVQHQLEQLTFLVDDLEATHLLMQERYRLRLAQANDLGDKASERQAAMAESYRQAMDELLSLLGQLQRDGVADINLLEQIENLLEQIENLLQQFTPQQQLPVHGLLPYQHLNYSQTTPTISLMVEPAYRSGQTTYVSADLQGSPEAPISKEITDQAKAIAALAGSQNWDPVAIYEWVKNNIETEWYFGAMKGAEETLRQGSGNDADQAALLVSLLRASGYPARYVRGVIEFFPGIDAVKSLTGIDDPVEIGEFFRKAGIPYQSVMNGAVIENFQVEHVWVEAFVPYANYRGAMADDQGKIWLPLDTSIKVVGYTETGSLDLYSEVGNPLSTIRDDYLSTSQTLSPVEYLQQEVETFLTSVAPGTIFADALHDRILKSENQHIIPGTLPYKEITITGEYSALPQELIHTVRLLAASSAPESLPIFDIVFPVYHLSNQKVVVSFEPETVADQEIINSWAGLDNTPAYLVRLRPVLMVNGERLIVGQEGLASGAVFDFSVTLNSPSGSSGYTNQVLTGYPYVMGIVAQDAVLPEAVTLENTVIDLLHGVALNYIFQWNQAEQELAELLNLQTVRPLPTVVSLSGMVEVTELLGEPQDVTWRGLFMDADLRVVETSVRKVFADERDKTFMQLSALQGSVLEHRLFEEAFGVESISTAKLFGLANASAISILDINAANVDAVVPILPYADNVKTDILDAVAQGMTVQIPANMLTVQDWTGFGYVKENRATGEVGYMLSGMTAGGMTAITPKRWTFPHIGAFEAPYSLQSNNDPVAAVSIHKVYGTDYMTGTAGEQMSEPLAVLVRDIEGRPVAGAEVTFTILSGGGAFPEAQQSLMVTTDDRGLAWTLPKLTLGPNIMADPTTYTADGYEYASYARENRVTAALANGTHLLQPFVAIALPGIPAQMARLTTQVSGTILQYAGEVGVGVADQYGNPVANAPIQFVAGAPTTWMGWCNVDDANQAKLDLQLATDEVCLQTLPSWGECATSGSIVGKTWSNGVVSAGVVLGSYPDGKYPITASYVGVAPAPSAVSFIAYTAEATPGGFCGGDTPPSNYFTLLREDSLKRVRPAAVPVTVRAKAEMVAEGVRAEIGSQNFDCNNETEGCPQVQGDRAFDFAEPDRVSLRFAGNPSLLNETAPDLYESEVILALGGNDIAIHASAERTLDLYKNSCELGCASQATPQLVEYTADWTVAYTGVAIDMPDAVTVKLDEDGYPVAAVPVSYTIFPVDYDAVSASFLVYEEDSLTHVVSSDTMATNTDTIPSGLWFDDQKNYTVQVVLNYNWGESEIWSDKIPVVFGDHLISGGDFTATRKYLVSEFDSTVPAGLGSDTQDFHRVFAFNLSASAKVKVSFLDDERVEQSILIPEANLAVGDYNFVVDYDQIIAAGFSPLSNPEFYIQIKQVDDANGQVTKISYRGHLSEQTSRAKMLGQTMVHDVMLQAGSLNLSRTDLTVPGRGPDFAFSRSYNNQNASDERNPLGNGWSHSLDLRLRLLNYENGGNNSVPDWVNTLKGSFFAKNQIPTAPTLADWNQVQVNGTVFKRDSSRTWYAQRGNHGRLEDVVDPESSVLTGYKFIAKDGTTYTYDRFGGVRQMLVTNIEDRNANALNFTYDEVYNRLEKVTDAVGREFVFAYESFSVPSEDPSRLVSITGPDNLLQTYTYDLNGNLQAAQRGELVETYEYVRESGISKADFNLVRAIDANGNSTRYVYHEPGEIDLNLFNYLPVVKGQDMVKQVIYPDGNAATFQYNGTDSNTRTVTDLRGFDTLYTLNAHGNPLKIEEPLGKTTEMTWSTNEGKPDNVMTSRTVVAGTLSEPRSLTTYFEYDVKGNVTKETDSYTNFIQTTWNEYGQPLTRIDRNGVEQHWTYDPVIAGCLNSHEVEVEEGVFKQTSSTCYATGEVQTVTDPLGHVSRTTYDLYGYPDLVTVAENTVDQASTDYDYDIRGRKVAETDPLGNQTTYAYDDLDYPTTVTAPLHASYALPAGSTNIKLTDYDALGNLLSEIDRTGLTLTYSYTPRNQVKTITRSASAASYGVKAFGYDGNGNLTSESDWKGVATNHSYDALNRRDSTTNRLGDSMNMGYDLAGNLTQVTDFEGRVTDYEYDDLNRQTKVIQPQLANQAVRGEIVSTYYLEAEPKSNLATVIDAEGNLTSFEYNGRYQKSKRTNALFDAFVWQYDDAGNLSKEIDEELNETRYEYDKQNRRTFTYRTLDGREFVAAKVQYDAAGNVTSVKDANQKITTSLYDEWNRPWQMISPIDAHAGVSYTTATERDGEGREVKITDGNNNPRTFERDARGLVTSATDAESQSTIYSYDTNGNALTATNARGFMTRTGYDAEDRKLLTIEAEGTSEERTSGVVLYDKVGNSLQVRDGNGNIFVTEYNDLNLPWQQYDPAPFDANFVEVLYDKNGRATSVTNRRGHTTTTSYDALGRVDTVTDPAPFAAQIVVTTYDKVGNVRTVKDKRGIVSETIYDDLYQATEQQRDGIRIVTNEYDDAGNLTATVDAENNRVEYAYSSRNQPERMTFVNPDGTDYFTERFYDGVGNLVTHSNEEGEVATTTYDKENRQKTIEFAGETTENVYDEVGNLIQVIKPKLNGSVMAYDGLNRLTSVTEGGLLTTIYSYDANNNQLSQADPLGNVVEFTYDELNRKKQHIQNKASGNLVVNYDLYDAEGNLTQMTDAKGQLFGYAYDELNRLTQIDHPLELTTPFMAIDKVETVYDANNNVATITETKQINGGGTQTDTTVNVWDNFDRLTSSTQRGITLSYGYDYNGNRTRVSTVNGSTTYGFDHRNRLETATVGVEPNLEVTSYSYTPDGLTDTITYPNGASADYAYHPTNRVQSITHTDSGAVTISSYSYTYDTNGNRTEQIEVQGGASETTGYVYDDLDRMESYTVTSGVDTTITGYTFEGYNRKTETVVVNGSTTVDKTYHYDETNWLNTLDDNLTSAVISYQYDANGNTTFKADSSKPGEETTFTYDVSNRLVQTEQNSSVLGQYDYNSQGMRIRNYGSERGDVDYFYDDGAVLEEYVAGAGGGLLAHYRYGNRLLSLETGTETQYYHHEALGSTVNLTGDDGLNKVSYSLDPWGHIRNQLGTTINRQIFTGQEHDENTGLIYFGARYYDPDTARFISQDSYLGEAGTPPSLRRYLYAYSNPLAYIDPDGHIAIFFDGTGKDKDNHRLAKTNIAKLYEAYGDGKAIYKEGVGSDWYTMYALGGVSGAGGSSRLDSAFEEFVDAFNAADDKNKVIDIFGFSRGAALARAFANKIKHEGIDDRSKLIGYETITEENEDGTARMVKKPIYGKFENVKVRFMGLFDTVASFGVPGNDVDFGYDMSVDETFVKETRHAVALNEYRGLFDLQSVAKSKAAQFPLNVVEMGFWGAHSDVGGGYKDDNGGKSNELANIPLNWIYKEAEKSGVTLKPLDREDTVLPDIGNLSLKELSEKYIHDSRSFFGRWVGDYERDVFYSGNK